MREPSHARACHGACQLPSLFLFCAQTWLFLWDILTGAAQNLGNADRYFSIFLAILYTLVVSRRDLESIWHGTHVFTCVLLQDSNDTVRE
jgi:hypothetical protein